jgi:hypothetical protein
LRIPFRPSFFRGVHRIFRYLSVFIHSIEIMVYNGVVLSALIYGTVYGDGDDGDKMDEFKTPMVYSIMKPLQPT